MSTATDPGVTERDGFVYTDPDLPPVGVVEPPGITTRHKIIFGVIALLGGFAWMMIAFFRGEEINSVYFVIAAVCTYVVFYRFYGRLIEYHVIKPRDDFATPAERYDNGKDFMPTQRSVLFGHHFAAIAGAGPLVGPVLSIQMGFMPGTLWLIFGVVLAGAVQDYMVLAISTRRGGRSLGQMAKDELGSFGGLLAIVGIISIMMILIAVLGVIVVNAMAESPWSVFSIAMTIPIAFFMGVYLRYIRPGRVTEISVIGCALLFLAIMGGGWVSATSWGKAWFTLDAVTLVWCLIIYGFAASVLPVWLLLAPRDYLSTFMKVGTIALLALGILIAHPVMQAPAVSQFASRGDGPVFYGALFPFLFITIACGSISGFHALISSGTTPKLMEKEGQARMIGYGGMLTESFVGVMALIAAAVIDQNIYFGMNMPVKDAQSATAAVNALHLQGQDPATVQLFDEAAKSVGEHTIAGRSGGAPTLAFGMAEVLHKIGGPAEHMKPFWYHFAVMFEALFILTTVDAGTRVARFMLSDALGNIPGLRRFKDPSWRIGAWTCSALAVAGWGSLLYLGIVDPLGGIKMFFPLFGIANQLLACIALTVVLVVVVKKGLLKWSWIPGVPLVWLLTVTLAASYQKIFSDDPKLGFFAQNQQLRDAKAAGTLPKGIKDAGALDQSIFNTYVQGWLQVLYALIVVLIVIVAMIHIVKAVTAPGATATSEEEYVPSRIFAPRFFWPTAKEKEALRLWDEAGLPPNPASDTTKAHAH